MGDRVGVSVMSDGEGGDGSGSDSGEEEKLRETPSEVGEGGLKIGGLTGER